MFLFMRYNIGHMDQVNFFRLDGSVDIDNIIYVRFSIKFDHLCGSTEGKRNYFEDRIEKILYIPCEHWYN